MMMMLMTMTMTTVMMITFNICFPIRDDGGQVDTCQFIVGFQLDNSLCAHQIPHFHHHDDDDDEDDADDDEIDIDDGDDVNDESTSDKDDIIVYWWCLTAVTYSVSFDSCDDSLFEFVK